MSIIDNLVFADVTDFDIGCGLVFVGFSCLAIFTFVSAVSASKSKRLHALMSATQTSLIRDLKSGPAEVAGRAKLKTRGLKSPWSNHECVYYRFHVENYVQGDPGCWHTYIDDSAPSSFVIADETGEIEILLSSRLLQGVGGGMDLHVDWHSQSGFGNDAPDPLKDLLMSKYHRDTQGLIFNKTLRYSETYLEAGDQVYVFGQASQADDGRWVMRHGEMPLIVSERGEHHVEKKVEKKAKWDSQLSGPIGAAVLAVVTLVVWVVGRP